MGPLDDQVVRADSLTATPDGLDIAVYSHWYRALPLPSLAKVDLTVDGERIDPDLAVGDRQRPPVRASPSWPSKGDEYWFTTDPVVLHVPVETAPGREHRVQLLLGLSIPYILTGPDRVPLVAPSCDRQDPDRGGSPTMTDTAPGLPRLGTTLFSLSLEQRKPGRDFASLVNEVAARDLGPGLEMVAFQSLRGWPRLDDAAVREVRGVIDDSGLTPVVPGDQQRPRPLPGPAADRRRVLRVRRRPGPRRRRARLPGHPRRRRDQPGDPRAAAAAGRGARREDRAWRSTPR